MTTLDLLLLVLAFCLLWVASALFWCIWQLSRFLHDARLLLEEAHASVARFEERFHQLHDTWRKGRVSDLVIGGVKEVIREGRKRQAERTPPDTAV